MLVHLNYEHIMQSFKGIVPSRKDSNHDHPPCLPCWRNKSTVIQNTLLSNRSCTGSLWQSAPGGEELLHLQVLRAFMCLMAWPLFSWWGSITSFKETIVLAWSGLRGAVGLSLALFILLDDQIADQSYRTLTFFHMGCVAFLTIVLQGTTMRPLLQVKLLYVQEGPMPICGPERAQTSFAKVVKFVC